MTASEHLLPVLSQYQVSLLYVFCPILLYSNETLPGSGLLIKDCWFYCIFHRLNAKNTAPNHLLEIGLQKNKKV